MINLSKYSYIFLGGGGGFREELFDPFAAIDSDFWSYYFNKSTQCYFIKAANEL